MASHARRDGEGSSASGVLTRLAIAFVLVVALCAGLVWVLVSWEVISASSVRGLTHITLAVLAIVLAVGLSWSHVSRRMTGQVDAGIVD